jgi:hypothetical protein
VTLAFRPDEIVWKRLVAFPCNIARGGEAYSSNHREMVIQRKWLSKYLLGSHFCRRLYRF